MNIFIDIETLPSLKPGAREIAAAEVSPPGNISKAETIATWWETKGEAAKQEAWRKQALDAATGELCAVGFADNDSEPVSLVRALDEPEDEFIWRALAAIDLLIQSHYMTAPDGSLYGDAPHFIGHNVMFDLGFLLRRCWVHGLKPAFPIPRPNAREGKDYGCTMAMWSGPRGNMISLDKLCTALGVKSPKAEGVSGSQVYDLWAAGDHDKLARYNAGDVAAAREVYFRLNFQGGVAA
jgi:hypothetical protein